jgi:hypothetical protein
MTRTAQIIDPEKLAGAGRLRSFGLRSNLFAPLLILGIIAAMALLYFFNPIQVGFYPICLFHYTTGLLCPGCGCLRATHQLLHGNLAVALRYNCLLIASLPLAVAGLARWSICRINSQPFSPTIRPSWLWCGFIVLIVFGILRNLSTPLKPWLGP